MIRFSRRASLPTIGSDVARRLRHLGPPVEDDAMDGIVSLDDLTLAPAATATRTEPDAVTEVTLVLEGTWRSLGPDGRPTDLAAGSLHVQTVGPDERRVDANPAADRPARVLQLRMPARDGTRRGQVRIADVDWTQAGNSWLPIAIPPAEAEPTAAGASPIRIDPSIRISVLELQAPVAVSHRFVPRSQGYVVALFGAVHLATDDDAVELDEGGGALVRDARGVAVRARTAVARVLLIETSSVDG